MSYPPDYRSQLGLTPETNDHGVADDFGIRTTGEALSDATLDGGLEQQIAAVQDILAGNAAAYRNRRAAIGLDPDHLRVISDVGRDQLFTMGLRRRGATSPIFRYFPPKAGNGTEESLRRLNSGDIRFVVMHSFGRDFDSRALSNGVRTVSIDPLTGHNPRRFLNGVRNVLDPVARTAAGGGRPAGAAIHHAVSLRGDLINSVSWDTRCVHGEGGGYNLHINDHSIGIEHEEWMAAPAPSRGHRVETNFREIEDHGPYSEETYSCDAFILKKLAAYTGYDYTRFLGANEVCRQNITNNVIGCFNHASTSGHADPGGDYFLPPEYELRVTDFRSMAETRDRTGAWQRRMEIWYADAPDGTRVSAYARIFEKVGRLRSFNLQTEVFDPTVGGGVITVTPTTPSGTYTRVLAEESARDRLSGMDRASRLASSSRVGIYSAADDSSGAVQLALARASSRLGSIADHSLQLPVVVNALAFDFTTGQWISSTSSVVAADVDTDPGSGPGPSADLDPSSVG